MVVCTKYIWRYGNGNENGVIHDIGDDDPKCELFLDRGQVAGDIKKSPEEFVCL